MRKIFTLDGVSSADFNTYVASSNMFNAPERDTETVDIPGRNGALVYDNGRFRNFEGAISCYVPTGMQLNLHGLRNWLLSTSAYRRYEDDLHPDEFRLARYAGGFAVDTSDRVAAAFTLSFDCKPQRFLKSGEAVRTCASGSVIYNPTRFDALPLIICSGNGSFVINGTEMVIEGNEGQIYIDCDLQDAYLGSENKNSLITNNFPKLVPGENVIEYTGLDSVQIMPRWWTV